MNYTLLQEFYSILYFPVESHNSSITLLKDICQFWESNKEFWFSHAHIDTFPTIQTSYSDDLDTNMALILHYDQIYRHPSAVPERNKQFGHRFATSLALKMLHNGQFEAATEWQKVFILLTLRHNKSTPLKHLALKKTYDLLDISQSPLLLRFLQATVWDIHIYKKNTFGFKEYSTDVVEDISGDAYKSILQVPQPVPSDYDHNALHGLFVDTFYKCLRGGPQRIAVSISGGVDSMVASLLAKEAAARMGKSIILLHISYNNRDCCSQEHALLTMWAKKLDVPLYIYSIDEIQRRRNAGFRTVYEEITRRIRFSFYDFFKCPVILGHNRDDCYENVFSNLAKNIHYDNLFGMRTHSIEDGVQIIRPMLDISKRDIYYYADYLGIPHLYDSTPAWSCRGRMRDKLIPDICAFNPKILDGLGEYVKYTSFLESQWKLAFNNWLRTIDKCNQREITIGRDDFFQTNYTNLNFWITFFQHVKGGEGERGEGERGERRGGTRPSNKSIYNLIHMIEKGTAHSCILSSTCRIRMTDTTLTIQYSEQ